ncbi:hypothetical protein IMZ48_07140, partial [Candidatus Bathyarchaeota archaeon]|nr:hypothetical protein [Candidatus Bathyarchaeota archaeon]
MSSNPAPWDAFDPLDDGIYYQVPYSRHEVLSKSTSAVLKTDEATVHRYEDVARQYLSGRAPRLITSSLKGPFDRASGFVNPWATVIKKQPATRQPKSNHPLKVPSPNLCEPATSPRPGETQTTGSSYPSPESLSSPAHPFLERQDVARVEKWRDLVQVNAPVKDEFWASSSRSSAKRPRDDSSWLKRRADKKPRRVEPEPKISSPVSIPDKNPRQQEASSPLYSLTSSSDPSTPPQASSQARVEANVRPGESTVAHSSPNGLPSSSQRLSQRVSQSSPPPRRSETLRSEGRRTQSPNTAVSKASPRRAAPARRSSPVAEPKPDTSGDWSTESSSQSSDEVLETKVDSMEPAKGPTVLVESDVVMKGQDDTQQSQPGEDRVLLALDSNTTPRGGDGDATGSADGEDAGPSTIITPSTPLQKPVDPSLKIQAPLVKEKEPEGAVLDPSVSVSPTSGPRNAGDSVDRHSQDRTAPEHHHGE